MDAGGPLSLYLHKDEVPNNLISVYFLTEMSTRNLPGGKGRPARKADNLTTVCEFLWASTACYRDSFAVAFTFSTKCETYQCQKKIL
jgi:hypothetical protein